ncbi:terminase [Desulfovibrio sp. OttesenSCG-928-G15]|nr:terminase [Desulfovibrio sp. OttesenSCG-928-G15]
MNEQSSAYETALADLIGDYTFDPLGFVLAAFPWGEGEIADMKGPQPWQAEELDGIAKALRDGENVSDAVARAIRRAIASGHGIGKSAFVAWIILWAMSTFKDARGVVTANTEAQLKGKTWPELAKWHRLCLCGHWFDCTATALISKRPGHDKTWRCDMVPWSERNTEAFAGLHNKGKRVLLVFDEASAIPDTIWDVSEGALTDDNTEIIWIVCGNPTRNTGRFRECFGRLRHRWHNRQVDSRTVSITNKAQLQEWVDDYGEDSDFVRVRVRGVFPRAGSCQLIPADIVDEAFDKSLRPEMYHHAPKVLGVDVARFGDDQSTFALRQGLACLKIKKFRGLDLMTFAGIVAQFIQDEQPEMTFVDQTGVGAGVVDRLRQLGIRNVIGVDFGGASLNKELYVNKRTEMWCLLRDWLKEGAAIPPDEELRSDLTAPEYSFTGDKGQMVLEKKADMKKRGLASPDCGDSLALTFAAPVRPSRNRAGGMDVLNARKKRATQRSNLY